MALSLLCGLPRTFKKNIFFFVVGWIFSLRKVRSSKKKKKSSGSPPCRGTEKGRLCTRKEPTGCGVYLQLVWAGLSDALLLWESLCSICRWQVKHKANPSLQFPTHTARRAWAKQPTSHAGQSSGGSSGRFGGMGE